MLALIRFLFRKLVLDFLTQVCATFKKKKIM